MSKFVTLFAQPTIFAKNLAAIKAANAAKRAQAQQEPAMPSPTSRATAVEPTQVQKRNAVALEVTKRAARLVKAGFSEEAARREVLNSDRSLYREYQKASYGTGPVVPSAPMAAPLEPGPVLQQVKALARELMLDDAWGRFAGKTEDEMTQEVFRLYPSLWAAYRAEVSGPGPSEEDPPKKQKR